MASPLNLVFLSPMKRPVTPTITASRPHMIYELTSRLVKRGHQVTIMGTGDSFVPGAKIIPVIEKGLSLMPPVENAFYQHTSAITGMLMMLKEKASGFDLVHNHLYPEFLPLLLSDALDIPMLTTVHAQMTPDLVGALKLFPQAHLAAISQAHARLAPELKFDVVYNGIDMEVYRMIDNPTKDYLLFIGRMTGTKDGQGNYLDPKGVLTAIEIAQRTQETLYISGNVEDMKFYETQIAPKLSDRIKFIGEISSEQPLSHEQVISLMQNAKAFLMPIHWEEPFGLVIVEANACGTPVIALNHGSVPELIIGGANGFIAKDTDSFVEMVKRIGELDRNQCRKQVEEKFSVEKMVDNYERIYYHIINN